MKIEIFRENKQESEKLYKVGDVVMIWDKYYLISQVDYDKINLISLHDGNRFDDPKSKYDYPEIEKLSSDGLTIDTLSNIFNTNVEHAGKVSLRIK